MVEGYFLGRESKGNQLQFDQIPFLYINVRMADILPHYRTEELSFPDMRLPGYQRPGSFPDMMQPNAGAWGRSDWWPVLSLSVFRNHPDDPGKIQTLTGVRNSDTHNEVVSTLTSAFDPDLEPVLFGRKHPHLRGDYPSVVIGQNGPDSRETAVIASYRPNISLVPDNLTTFGLLCHDVFARKLGLSELVNMSWGEKHLGRVSLMRVIIGLSYIGEDPDGTPLWEPLKNWGAAFMLDDAYRDAIPSSTKRYSTLGWTDVDTFADHVKGRSVMGLAPYLEEGQSAGFCVRGLCLATTAKLTEAPDLRAHLGLEPDRELSVESGMAVGKR